MRLRLAGLLHFTCLEIIAQACPRAPNLAFVSSDCSPSHRRLYTSPASIKQTRMMSGGDEIDPLSKHSLPKPLLLGSSSFTRKLILREMNVPFHIIGRLTHKSFCRL